jgi:hypothetical protein
MQERCVNSVCAAAGFTDTSLVYPSFLREVDEADIPQCRVPACWALVALDTVEHIGPSLIPRAAGFERVALAFQRREEDSISALSQQSPERLIEQLTLLRFSSGWNCALVYWQP